jgi:hypothetical protein
MKPSEYPSRSCREAVTNQQGMFYSCELRSLHMGPCASQSVQATIERRDAWEKAHPADAATLRPSDDLIDFND